MDQLGIGGVDDAVAGFDDAEAEIDVVKSDCEVRFVQTANLLVNAFSQHHAGRGDGGKILDEVGTRKIAGLVTNADVRVVANSACAKDRACVLNCAVRIPQPRPNRANLWTQSMTDHFAQPAGVRHFDVIIDECDYIASCLRYANVVQLAEVEFTAALQQAHIDRWQFSESRKILERFCFAAFVIDDKQLKARVIGPRENTFDGSL